jgi:hypothetical protein
MQQDGEAAIEITTVFFPNIFTGWEVGVDRHAQAAVSLGKALGSSWMSMEKRKIYYTHRRSNLNCQVHWKFGGLL